MKWLQEYPQPSGMDGEVDWEDYWFKAVLSDLATSSENPAAMESVPDEDVEMAIKHYLRGIFRIGNQLKAEGLLDDMLFSEANLLEVQKFIDEQVGTVTAQRMLREFRRFSTMLLEIYGTRSDEQVIQLNKETFGVGLK